MTTQMIIVSKMDVATRLAQQLVNEKLSVISKSNLAVGDYKTEELKMDVDLNLLSQKIIEAAANIYPEGPYDEKPRLSQDIEMDHEVIKILSEFDIPDEIGFRPEFWNSFQLFYVATVVYQYRHAKQPSKPDKPTFFNLQNLVCRDIYETYLGRQWLRLALTRDEKNKYDLDLALRGSGDFWRSHVFRQKSVWGRNIVRAFVKYQYPTNTKTRLWEGTTDKGKSVCDGIRLFIKQLAGSTAVKSLDIMDEVQLEEHMQLLAKSASIRTHDNWDINGKH